MLKIHKEKSRIFDRKKKVLPFQKLLREKGELNMETEWRNYRKKNYEELELKDDFMFGKVMQNEELCRRTLETLLEMPIRGISSLERQKGIELLGDRKGIRLDIYVRDADKTVYDAEMQQRHKKEDEEGLPKRTRYYQGLIDLDILESGGKYQELPDSYIIFICTFDPFGKNRSRYTFGNVCLEDTDIRLHDGAVKIFFNTKGSREGMNADVRMLLEYLDTKTVANKLTEDLDRAVEEVRRNEKWRLEYMKERFIYIEAREDGRLDGLEEGREEGRKEGLEEGRKAALEEAQREAAFNMAEMLVKNVEAAMRNFHVDLPGACNGLGIHIEEYGKAKEMLDSLKE